MALECPKCKGTNKIVIGKEIYMIDGSIWLAPILHCYACGTYIEPWYTMDIKQDGNTVYADLDKDTPIRICVVRGSNLESSNMRRPPTSWY